MPAVQNITGGPGSAPTNQPGDIWANPNNGLLYQSDGTTPKTNVFEYFATMQMGIVVTSWAVAQPLKVVASGRTETLTKAGVLFSTAGGQSLQIGLTWDPSGTAYGAGTLLTNAATMLCGAGGGSANVPSEGTLKQAAEYPLVGPGAISVVFSGTVTGLVGCHVYGETRRLN